MCDNVSHIAILYQYEGDTVKNPKSFRLSEQALDALEHIVASTGINETAIVERLLIDEAMRFGWVPPTMRFDSGSLVMQMFERPEE